MLGLSKKAQFCLFVFARMCYEFYKTGYNPLMVIINIYQEYILNSEKNYEIFNKTLLVLTISFLLAQKNKKYAIQTLNFAQLTIFTTILLQKIFNHENLQKFRSGNEISVKSAKDCYILDSKPSLN